MLRSTAIAAVLSLGVTTAAVVDMASLFAKSGGFSPEAQISTIAYGQNTDRNNVSRPTSVQIIAATGKNAVKHDTPDTSIIDATNYVDWKNIYRA